MRVLPKIIREKSPRIWNLQMRFSIGKFYNDLKREIYTWSRYQSN